MARFQHPYAVTLYDASLEDPRGPILVMEHVPGVTLAQLLKANRGRLSVGRVNRLLGQFCDVLQAAHDQGIAHGSLRPDNVFVLEADTPYEKIKILLQVFFIIQVMYPDIFYKLFYFFQYFRLYCFVLKVQINLYLCIIEIN